MPHMLSILIIDDNADDRENYIRLLRKNPDIALRYHEAAEGEAGLEAVGLLRPDCVLLDYSLPGVNGLDVLRRIKALHSDVPVVLLTGQGSEAIAVQAIKLGADDYLAKSAMSMESLWHAIRMATEHRYLQNKIDEQTALLLKKEMRYQQLIDGVHDYAFCWLDVDGCVESWNSGAERMTGYASDEVLTRHMAMFYSDDDCRNDLPRQALKKAFVCGNYAGEGWHLRKDGSLFWASIQIDVLRAAHGQAIGYVRVTRDITERRNAELQRQQLIDQLMQSNTELERFAYVASHDMQEPVRMVTNFSRIIADDYGDRLDDEGRGYLTFITDSAERIHAMIDDLLDYARLGSEDYGVSAVDGALELRHVLDNLDSLIQTSGAQITHDDVPVFQGNPIQFMRLMQNLIANAIKYQPPGNVPKVHIGVEDYDSAWRLSVEDNGLGVDEAFTQKIFEPFRRLHSWEHIKGTGLGLSVCKKIVENHGGKIWLTSTPGQGSIFYITIPKTPARKQIAA